LQDNEEREDEDQKSETLYLKALNLLFRSKKEKNVMKAYRLWVRWILVLPVAFTIDMLAQSIAQGLLSYLIVTKSLAPFINSLIWQVLAPLAFVAGGVIVAPKYKFETSISLGGIQSSCYDL
jgi:hypothetical protein